MDKRASIIQWTIPLNQRCMPFGRRTCASSCLNKDFTWWHNNSSLSFANNGPSTLWLISSMKLHIRVSVFSIRDKLCSTILLGCWDLFVRCQTYYWSWSHLSLRLLFLASATYLKDFLSLIKKVISFLDYELCAELSFDIWTFHLLQLVLHIDTDATSGHCILISLLITVKNFQGGYVVWIKHG